MIIVENYFNENGVEFIREFDDELYFYAVAKVDERVFEALADLSEKLDEALHTREVNFQAHNAYLKAESELKSIRSDIEELSMFLAFRTNREFTSGPEVINYPSRLHCTKVTAYDQQGREYEVIEGKEGYTLGQPTGKSRATFIPEV